MRSIVTTSLAALLCLTAAVPPVLAADKPLSQEERVGRELQEKAHFQP